MFGSRLKECRKANGISQYALAEQLSVAQSTIAAWESGSRKPDIDMLNVLADYFNVSSDYLLGRDDVDDTKAEPTTIAAHTDAEITPELKARIDQLVKQAIEKYAGRKVFEEKE